MSYCVNHKLKNSQPIHSTQYTHVQRTSEGSKYVLPVLEMLKIKIKTLPTSIIDALSSVTADQQITAKE